jgi:carbazole 1,9a-dioxygenase ferredoxin component
MKFICHAGDVADGTSRRIELEGRAPLAVFNVEDEFYVTDDTCTHGLASLCDGEIDGHEVECPFHQGAFDVRTGVPVSPPCTLPIRIYKVRVEDGRVLADLGA